LFFLTVFLQNRLYWWALIPGFTLFGIAALILVSWLAPGFGEVWGGAFVLGSIGAAFLVIFLLHREHWWALIPAGVMLTLALVSTFDAISSSSFDTGGLFFLGLGLTFALVALVPTQHGQMSWAWIPAGIMGLMGMFILASSNGIASYLWPAVLIAGGALLVLRAWRPRAE
jgi:hypothetical protein